MTVDRLSFLAGISIASLLALSPLMLGTAAVLVRCSPSGEEQEALRADLVEVFLALQSAESRGADISAPLQSLNHALALIQDGKPESLDQARLIISEVNATVPRLLAEGDQSRLISSVGLYSFLASLAAVGALSYLYLPRLIWRSWVKAKRRWEVAAS
ncbi:MAG: hypothetical protein Metus_1411 [Candidatus Methanosuratincola subterraneus]|uniref:DUF2937 family protein n=1 Tax=Methanosuratincola subterraneus TaxID=2593994 RepID=A0A444L777_METS7|nr:MAG: hypothetical protein Metus_1411 [Candidatus Methanosuratincola subterraneus]